MTALPLTLGLTAGDLCGVGPELIEQVLISKRWEGVEFRMIGSVKPSGSMNPGQPSRESALAAMEALEEAAHLALRGEIDGVVTAPVCKHNLKLAGFGFPGQTEFFAARAGVNDFAMLLTGGSLTVALVTAHVALENVVALLEAGEISRVGRLLYSHLRQRGVQTPRIAVAGCNPHAGENGDLGRQEIEIISPAVEMLEAEFPGCFSGPHSPDTVFFQAVSGNFDAVLCMYHDQGLIPLKLHAFHSGVNVTLGLPFVRTSPDHGTAFALAGRGIASASSFFAAVDLAVELIRRRQSTLIGVPPPPVPRG